MSAATQANTIQPGSVDVVAVIVVDYENVTVSAAGRNKEAAGEIGSDLASDMLAVDKETVRADGCRFADWIGGQRIGSDSCVVGWSGRRDLNGRRLCGPQVCPLLI